MKEETAVAYWELDVRMPIPGTRLEQQDSTVALTRQPIGEHAACGARADNDVVVVVADVCRIQAPRAPMDSPPGGSIRSREFSGLLAANLQ
jgi:hypothetical protein